MAGLKLNLIENAPQCKPCADRARPTMGVWGFDLAGPAIATLAAAAVVGIVGLSAMALGGCERQDNNTGANGTNSSGTGTTGTGTNRTNGTTGTTTSPGSTTGTTAGTRTNPSTVPPGTPNPDAANTGRNARDRDMTNPTPPDQAENESDRKVTAEVRRAIMADSTMSMNAQNCKIITKGGMVTLRGPVNTQAEKDAIETKAKAATGVTSVVNELEVKTTTGTTGTGTSGTGTSGK